MFSPDTWQFEAPDGRTETVRVAGQFTCTNAGSVLMHQLRRRSSEISCARSTRQI